ncbi:MAG: hypothetical protein LBK97_00060, partial [Prevotellaceae bacterium]|nr:hypothetical protein [Prevotellaceae bacterium]
MHIKLFFKIIFGLLFLIGSQHIQAQNCGARIEAEVDGTTCENGKATVTLSVKAADGSNLDISKCYFVTTVNGKNTSLSTGENQTKLNLNSEYIIRAVFNPKLQCNGEDYDCPMITIKAGLKMTDFDYKRNSDSDILISATVSGGKGPYKYQLIANGVDVTSGSSQS